MTNFNMWVWNSRVFPGIDPLAVRLGDKVRVRMGNLTMTNHPIHLHGHNFAVSCTDGGWVPKARSGQKPPSMFQSARFALLMSSLTIPAIGRFTVTSRITP